jgi:hypothetical protein
MSPLPPAQTPLYHHPLPELERWLTELGAVQGAAHSCLWRLSHNGWTAELELEIEELSVRWQSGESRVERQFPYGLSREDVEAAILAGP